MNNQQHPNQFDDLAKLYYDRLLAQNGRGAVKGDRLDRKPTLFDDIPIEANPCPQAMTLEQQRAIALARARRRREGEAKQGRRPTLFDDLVPQERRHNLFDYLDDQPRPGPQARSGNLFDYLDVPPQSRRPTLFDDLIPQARKPSLYDDIVPQGRRPTLFDDLPMEGSQQAEPSLLGSIATGAVSGLTLGFDDEIAAGLNTGFGFAGDYSQELERQRAIQGQYRDANPWAAGAGEIGGALATAPLTGSLNVLRGAGLGARVANSALTGAGYGAAYGAGTSEGDLADRGRGALWGGSLGALGGAVVPGVIAGVRGVGSTVRNAFGGPKGVAARRLAKALERSGKTAADVQDDIVRARAGGAEGYAAVDSLGKPGQKLLRGANTVSETAAEQNAKVLGARNLGQGDRVMRQVRGALGDGDEIFKTLDDLAAKVERDAAPLFQKAYSENLPELTPGLQNVLARPAMKDALRRGHSNALNRDVDLPKVMDEAGNITSAPDLQTLHWARRALNDMIEDSYNTKVVGTKRATTETGSLMSVKKALDAEIAKPGSTFKRALEEAADSLSLRSALEEGTKALNADPALIVRRMAKLRPAEQEAYRMGVAKAVRNKIGGMGDSHDAVARIFGAPDSRARLEAVWPDPADFEKFSRYMADEATMTGTNRFIGGQSATADKALEAADISQLAEFVRHPIRASGQTLAAALSRAGGMREKSGAEIARLLTDPSASLGAVDRARTRDALVRQLLRRGGAVSGGLAGGALGQTDGR